MEAHRVQGRANQLEKEEMEKYKRAEGKRGRTNLQNLRGKQEAETKALRMRVQLQVEER